jgi:thiol-disulfide isomerase/thioredoxin
MLYPTKSICVSLLAYACVTAPVALAETPTSDLWSKFEEVEQGTRALHQEFEVVRNVKSGYSEQTSRFQVILDFSQGKWREQPVGTGGERIRVFDGHDLFVFEPGGTEYSRPKQADKDKPSPEPYENKVDWRKAKEVQRLPCGFSGKDHECVIIEAPIKPWLHMGLPGEVIKMADGIIRVMADTETGIWLRAHVSASVERGQIASQWDLTYNIKQMAYGATPDMSLFELPKGLKEVKDLTRWVGYFKEQLSGKPAPALQVTDIHGTVHSLAELKGKTVLLDFWTTWCPPCQSDASSIEKLNQKYGNKNLAIIGISVDEERATVENYLKKHPHSYPVVLSSENRLPRTYQVDAFPTYLIISPDGTVVTAEQGDKGFGSLRKDLEKAGMSVE